MEGHSKTQTLSLQTLSSLMFALSRQKGDSLSLSGKTLGDTKSYNLWISFPSTYGKIFIKYKKNWHISFVVGNLNIYIHIIGLNYKFLIALSIESLNFCVLSSTYCQLFNFVFNRSLTYWNSLNLWFFNLVDQIEINSSTN